MKTGQFALTKFAKVPDFPWVETGLLVHNDSYDSAEQFLEKLDAGELKNILQDELGKMTSDQRGDLAAILLERKAQRFDETKIHLLKPTGSS